MNVIPPIPITDALLTATNAPETPPAGQYAGGTTYAIGNQVYTGTKPALLSVYQSLQNGNIGNTPPAGSSNAFWQYLGDVYAIWASGITYALNDIVAVIGTNSHLLYQSLQGSNTNQNPATATSYWALIGATNAWKMFDLTRNLQTTVPSPLTVTITPGQRVNSLALLNLAGATSVTVVMTSVIGGGTVYNKTQNLNTRYVFNWYDYFFNAFSTAAATAFFDLPPYTDCIITVTLTNAVTGGSVSCGGLVIGNYVFLGDTQYNANADALNFSTVTRDAFGNATFVPRRNVPTTKQTLRVASSRVNALLQVKEALNTMPAVWAGVADPTSDYFNGLLIKGFYRKFAFPIDQPTSTQIDLQLEQI